MCCIGGKCSYKTTKICIPISQPFCSKHVVRHGKCKTRFCCKLNKNKKYNCRSHGRKKCFIVVNKPVEKCSWKYYKSKKDIRCKKKNLLQRKKM